MDNNKPKISKSDLATLSWMWHTFKKERWHLFIIIIATVINAVLTVSYAEASKRITNAASVDKSWDLALRYSLIFLGIVLLQFLCGLIVRSFTERCKARIEVTLRQHILTQTMKKDYSEIIKKHTADIQNRMTSDVAVISDGFTSIIPNLVHFVVKLCCAFGYLIFTDKIFSLIFLVGGLGVFLFTQVFRRLIKRLHKIVQETEGNVRAFIQEILTSLLVIKSFTAEDKVNERADELMEINYKAKMKRRFVSIFANAGINLVFNAGYVFAMGYGAYLLVHGIDYGTITAILLLVNQIQAPFASLSGLLQKYFGLVASAERIMEIDSIIDEVASNSEPIDVDKCYASLKTIDFKDISFSYDRDIILNDTSLQINKGDFVAIMGISGIGKSTLLKLLLGVYHPNAGSITLQTENGEIPVDCNTRRLFTYVPQGNFLLSGTIRDNLTFINDNATDDEINQALRIACADSFVNELPEGINTVIGERGIGLSEGQLQRLAIARAVLSKCPVMLLDEATSALDEATELRFLQNLKDMQDKTCIIVSHKTAALEICNKHIQIIDSKIVVEGE